MTITTLRPSATSSGVGWTATPSGTLHGVTSDDSDSTYALWSGSGSALILATPADEPPAGERRHQARLRMRGEDGDAWGAVRLASGALAAGVAAPFTSSPGTVTGSWGFGVPADGSTVLSAYVTGQTSGVKLQEIYLDVDSRLAPTFTAQVIDGSGVVTTTVSDTAQPTIRASGMDLDGLSARQYRYWVTLGSTIVWDTGVVPGPTFDRQTTALDNGTYVAHLQVWSTLGSNTAYASDEEIVTFTVSVGAVPAPENPIVSQVAETPFYELEVCAPYAGDFDSGQAYIEIQRVDCPQGGYLLLPGSDSYASTPGGTTPIDLQITVYAQRDDFWIPSVEETVAARYDTSGNNRSWRLSFLAGNGRPFLSWSTDGGPTLTTAFATDRPSIDSYGRAWLRVLLDTNNGSGSWVATFYHRPNGEWTQLGDVRTGATAALFASTAPYTVGGYRSGSFLVGDFTGQVYSLEVRDGLNGPIKVSPDFTGHPVGTTSFLDGQSNLWTVTAPATIVSNQTITSVAILGPLDTDECATYVDYSLPRTGIGATCTHSPELCCSYYRARTLGRIDGALQISDWSDAYDPGIPNGLIFLWPDTASSVPEGWSRVTDLDSRYPKGVATTGTQPGTTGGAASHTHTVSGHTHDTSHLHTTTGNTSTGVGAVSSNDGAAGNTAIATTHTHTTPSTASTTVVSGSTSPTIGTANNDPARLEVLFIESNGQPLGVPDGALALTSDTSLPGWTDYAAATGRFVKGAAPAGNGGTTAASALDNHTHSIGAHTHTGTSHSHTSNNTGTVNSTLSLFAGPNSVTWTISHAHPISIGTTSTSALDNGGSGTSGASSLGTTEPPFTNVRIRENTSGSVSLPIGLIGIWRGSLGSIPDHWALCDGTGSTPDLIGRYPKGATSSIGSQGGSLDPHTHTSPTHTHSTSGHAHTMTIGVQNSGTANVSATATVSVSNATHTHTHGNTDSTTPSVASSTSGTLASTTSEPPFEEVAFVQLVGEPTPPPVAEEFCLTWDDDYHLIRTEGPDGPMWSQVGGLITWDRDRPFTTATGVMGGRFVTSAAPGGRNLRLSTAVESEAELTNLKAVLARPLVLISPSDSSEVWASPISGSVQVVKIGRIRQVTADFTATGPQPPPQLADVG